MANADLKILISVTNEAKGIIDGLVRDLAHLSGSLQKIGGISVGDAASQSLGKVGTASKTASGELDGLRKKGDDTNAALGRLANVTKLVVSGFLALKAVGVVKGFADTAARTETLGVTLRTIAENAGITASAIEETDRQVQKLGITAAASRQSLSQFIQAGLDISKASELATVAQDAAVIAGANSSETFQRLITNIQQVDVMGLRWMGIIVQSDAAFAKYAKTLNKGADSLSGVEKQTAILNAVLERGVDIAGVYDAAMDTVGKQLSSLPRYHEELATALGNLLLPAYSALVKEFTAFLKFSGDIADDLDEQGETGARFGEVVGSIARAVRLTVQTLIQFKEVLIGVGIALGVGKLVAWSTAVVKAATGVRGAATAVAIFKGVLGGLPGILISITTALAAWLLSTERGQTIIRGVGTAIEQGWIIAMLNLEVLLVRVSGRWEAFKAFIRGDSGGRSAIIEQMHKDLDELDARLAQAKAARASAVATYSGSSSVAGVDTDNTAQVTAAISARLKSINDLKLKYGELKTAGQEEAAEAIKGQVKKENGDLRALRTVLDKIKARKDLTAAEKAAIKQVEEELAADGKRRAAEKEFRQRVEEAQKLLKTSDWVIEGDKIFSSEAKAAVSGFRDLVKSSLGAVQAGGYDAETAMGKLKKAFETLVATAKTKDDLQAIRDLLKEIGTSGDSAADRTANAAVAAGLQNDPSLGDAERRVAEEQRAKYKARLEERRALQKSQAELAQAEQEAQYAAELARLRRAMAEQDDLYNRGKLSIQEYYAAKRKEAQRSAAAEEASLRAELAQINREIKDKAGKTAAEINTLKAQRINLEGQLRVKIEDTAAAQAQLNREERDALELQRKLLAGLREELLDVTGKSTEARKSALDRELTDRLKEIKLPEGDERSEAIANLTKLYDIKKRIVDLDERSAVLRVNSEGIAQLEADLNRQLELGLINRLEHEAGIHRILRERITLAKQELEVLLASANASSPEVQAQILQKKREIFELETRSITQLRKSADDINKIFETASSNFLNGLMEGTKTWGDLLRSVLADVAANLSKMAASRISEGLFSKGGTFDIGGALAGDGQKEGLLSSVFGNPYMGRDSVGKTRSNPMFVQDVSALGTAGKSKVSDAVDAVTSEKTAAASAEESTSLFSGMFDSLNGVFSNLLASLKSGLSSLVEGIGGLFGDFGGQNIFGAIAGMFGFAEGGYVSGPGTGTSDSIPARLSNGEFVIRQSQTAKWLPLLAMINEGVLDNIMPLVRRPTSARFASGGLVDLPGSGAPSVNANTKIVNLFDMESAMAEFMNTRAGERAILNIIQRNK